MGDMAKLFSLLYIQMKILITLCIVAVALAAVDKDIVSRVPGYPEQFNTSVYSGYLTLGSPSRGIHYVFVESQKGKGNKDPVTLWMNGGPGCSSMLGFLQQIGPYYLEDGKNYNKGDNLTFNPYSWHNVSNLLFFESPTEVGFSYNDEKGYKHNDHNTCQDNFDALQDFFKKFPEYLPNAFWIAGQSYAGKYIPDLAVKIDKFNDGAGAGTINFKGILVGNGIMTFQDGSLESSSAEYMVDHEFIDPQIIQYWKSSCQFDPHSAGCRFFHKRFNENVEQINPYNVYSYCFYNTTTSGPNGFAHQSQQSMLYKMMAKAKKEQKPRFNGAPCAYFDGVFNYFNLNSAEFHARSTDMKWLGPCNGDIDYTIDLSGSIPEYRILLARLSTKKYQMVLYSGDWDDVVPYHDTIKGIRSLYLTESYIYHPWFTGDQHSGFSQLYNGILFLTVKGASHQVPQSKRAEAFQMFNNILSGHVESHPGFGVKEE